MKHPIKNTRPAHEQNIKNLLVGFYPQPEITSVFHMAGNIFFTIRSGSEYVSKMVINRLNAHQENKSTHIEWNSSDEQLLHCVVEEI